jgi:hypothetical protein
MRIGGRIVKRLIGNKNIKNKKSYKKYGGYPNFINIFYLHKN